MRLKFTMKKIISPKDKKTGKIILRLVFLLNAGISSRVPADISGGTAQARRAVHINITFCNHSCHTAADFL